MGRNLKYVIWYIFVINIYIITAILNYTPKTFKSESDAGAFFIFTLFIFFVLFVSEGIRRTK
jgi:hypothetical protein